jgi:hypothetical protein
MAAGKRKAETGFNPIVKSCTEVFSLNVLQHSGYGMNSPVNDRRPHLCHTIRFPDHDTREMFAGYLEQRRGTGRM